MRARVLIADDHGLMRAGLRSLLSQDEDFEVVGEASSSDEALATALQVRPDLVLMDLSMPGEGGIAVTRLLREKLPEARVVILTLHEDEALLKEAIRAGAVGYIVKRAVESELLAALHAARRGEIYVHPSMTKFLLQAAPPERSPREKERILTRRELDVVRLLACGYTNRQIGEELDLSVRTVETHRANVMAKLGISGRAELVRWAAARRPED